MNRRWIHIIIISLFLLPLFCNLSGQVSSQGNGTEPISETKTEEADYFTFVFILIVIIIVIALPIIIVIITLYFTNRKLSQVHAQLQTDQGLYSRVPPPPCPYCNTGLVFVDEYRKWYCESCNSYY